MLKIRLIDYEVLVKFMIGDILMIGDIMVSAMLTRFPIKMRFLYHETAFLICENKRTKDRKTNHVIKCVMMII